MSKKPKPLLNEDEEQVRTTVSMTKKFWQDDVEKLMKEEGFNNFSSYMAFLVKLRRENLHQRRMEVDRLDGTTLKAEAAALNETGLTLPKKKAV